MAANQGVGEYDWARHSGRWNGPRGGGRGPRGPNTGGGGSGPIGRLFERLPPHSLESEMSVLGSLILDHRVAVDVIGIISGKDDFYSEAHGAIYGALVELADRHNSGDLVQLNEMLRDRGVLEQVGGPDYLVELAHSVPSAVNAPHYARIVAERARLRRLIDAAGQILWDAYHHGDHGLEGAAQVVDLAEMMVFEIAQEREKSDPQKFAELLEAEIARLEAAEGKGISGVKTGFHDLDRLLSGLQPGEMIVIAARPSMGKTALALNIAEQVARGGVAPDEYQGGEAVPVGFFSLEMSKAAIAQRLLSAATGVDSHKLRTGHLSRDELGRVKRDAEGLKLLPIFVDDTPGLDVLQLRSRARRMKAAHGVRGIMIDYLQLMSAPAAARESRQVEVSAISRQVKALARELNVPVVCLSQLNRASEQREGNRPRMSDLRESGSIEQDADVVILLHREDYYHVGDPSWADENPDKAGVAELIVAKQRNGPTGVVRLTWASEITRFRNHAGAEPMDFGGHAIEAKPAHAPWATTPPGGRSGGGGGGFHPGGQTGPVEGHRDGGGPEKDLVEEAPFEEVPEEPE